ncbi:MAG: DNA repair protein RecN [Myxococcota bacterium]
MLQTLCIRDYILIEELELELHPGLNVITGETGAGKSMLVGALGLILGRRARGEAVRGNAERAELEAQFAIDGDPDTSMRLREAGLPEPYDELVIRRVLHRNGRSKSYINGRLAPLSQLQALAATLADVTSQHDGVELIDPRRQLAYLDRYGGLEAMVEEVERSVALATKAERRLAALTERIEQRDERESYLRFKLDRLIRVAPEPGEMARAREELIRLKHVGKLQTLVSNALRSMSAGEAEGAADALGQAAASLSAAAELDPSLRSTAHEAEAAWRGITDIVPDLERYIESLEARPERLEALQERVFVLEKLIGEYGGAPASDDVDGLLEAQCELEEELDGLGNLEAERQRLEAEAERARDRALGLAQRLSQEREKAGRRLARVVTTNIRQLAMKRAQFEVEVERDPTRLSGSGIDRLRFLLCSAPGNGSQELSRVASGGELSRTLLAIKGALQSDVTPDTARQIGVQVFDEVDTGVGGAAADKIGAAIARIARRRQVLTITHLATIAAYADRHFVVDKRGEEALFSCIKTVDGKHRLSELARMMTGKPSAQGSLAAARELLTRIGSAAA